MPAWMLCSGKGPEFDPRDVFHQSPCCSPLWHSIIVMCIAVDSKTFWKMKQVLFNFELSKAPTLCQILSRCLLNSVHSFELLIITDKQDNFQWPTSRISFISSELGRGVFRYRFAKVKHFLSIVRAGGCFIYKIRL